MEENSFISDSTSIEEIEIKSKRYEYNGYEPPIGLSDKIDIIAADIESEFIFNEYVVKRKPVVIKDFLNNEEFKTQNWTLSYLREKAGECKVFIEDRSKSEASNAFGIKAPKIMINYNQFLDRISLGNEELYLTTQEIDSDVDKFGMPKALFGDPLTHLKEDFPHAPKCFAFLVPHLISLWQGCSKEGTSSGLHHDFHDNLYLVVRGSKKFRILPPSNHEFLKMPIKPVRIYSNGLIVYSRNKYYPDLIPVRSDGVPYEFLAQTIRDEARAEMTRCKMNIKKFKKEKSTDCDSALIPLLCVHG